MNIIKQQITKLTIHEAKGLRNLEITFKKEGLTGILGPNGSGKSTILHLLACGYNAPDENIVDYRFPSFFLPTKYPNNEGDFNWINTKFTYTFNIDNKPKPLEVKKSSSRWMRYDKRPKRWCSYIGIETCVPDIEKEKLRSIITFSGQNTNIRIDNRLLNDASYILRKEYQSYQIWNRGRNRSNKRVQVNNVQYTSLSMGAGEQRVFTILEEVYKAPAYGLILIDELDLLLHQSSLLRLIEKLVWLANNKHLQIIFTAHNPSILSCKDIEFRHIYTTNQKSLCLVGNDPNGLYQLTEQNNRDIEVYVEDELSKALVQKICAEENCMTRVKVSTFGPADNAFSLVTASGLMPQLRNRKILFVLDGDVYTSDQARLQKLQQHLTGQNNGNLRNSLLNKMKQFRIENKPEEYYRRIICELPNLQNGLSSNAELLVNEVLQLNIIGIDHHDYFLIPFRNLGLDIAVGYSAIAEILSSSERWEAITEEIRNWIRENLNP